jgi:hypothetical protein
MTRALTIRISHNEKRVVCSTRRAKCGQIAHCRRQIPEPVTRYVDLPFANCKFRDGDIFRATRKTRMSDANRKTRGIKDTILGIWWIAWFGIIGGFLFVSGAELWREFAQRAAVTQFSSVLFVVIVLSWVAFYIATSRFGQQWTLVWRLFTAAGSILAIITIVAIYFFITVAPRVQ